MVGKGERYGFFLFSFPCFFVVILMFRACLHALAKFIKKRKKERKKTGYWRSDTLVNIILLRMLIVSASLFNPYRKVCIYQ